MSTRPWRGTLIFAGTVAAVAAAGAARFAGADMAVNAAGTTTTTPDGGGSSASSGNSSNVSSGGGTDAAATPNAAPAASGDVTIVGSTVQTRYGPVQVSVSFSGADITTVEALQSPGGHRESVQINAYALPILAREATSADSAAIDTVSGATYTSEAYRQSLQSAIDQHG